MSGSALLAQLVHTGPEPTVIVLLFVLQSFLLAPKQSSTHPYELVFFFFFNSDNQLFKNITYSSE